VTKSGDAVVIWKLRNWFRFPLVPCTQQVVRAEPETVLEPACRLLKSYPVVGGTWFKSEAAVCFIGRS